MNIDNWIQVKKKENEEKLRLQKQYCDRLGLPCFIEQVDKCPKCDSEILVYVKKWEAENKHITSCPCGYSLCEQMDSVELDIWREERETRRVFEGFGIDDMKEEIGYGRARD